MHGFHLQYVLYDTAIGYYMVQYTIYTLAS